MRCIINANLMITIHIYRYFYMTTHMKFYPDFTVMIWTQYYGCPYGWTYIEVAQWVGYVLCAPVVGGVAEVSTTAVWNKVGMPQYRRVVYPNQHQCQAQYKIFYCFIIYKNLCIWYVFKIYISFIKKHWWTLASSWLDELKTVGQPKKYFKKKI